MTLARSCSCLYSASSRRKFKRSIAWRMAARAFGLESSCRAHAQQTQRVPASRASSTSLAHVHLRRFMYLLWCSSCAHSRFAVPCGTRWKLGCKSRSSQHQGPGRQAGAGSAATPLTAAPTYPYSACHCYPGVFRAPAFPLPSLCPLSNMRGLAPLQPHDQNLPVLADSSIETRPRDERYQWLMIPQRKGLIERWRSGDSRGVA